jgi:ankyrin repeat protein
LHYAIRTASIKLVRLLMENGADPTAKAEDGSTPVDVAEQYQCTDVLDCLQCRLIHVEFFKLFKLI